MNKKVIFYQIIPVALLLLVTGLFFLFFKKDNLVLYRNSDIKTQKFFDAQNGGETEINSFINSADSIYFSYSTGKKENSYAGVDLFITNEQKERFSGYDYVNLKLSAKNVSAMLFEIRTFEKGVSKGQDLRTYRNNYYRIINSASGKIQRKKLRLDDFETQDWWLRRHFNDITEESKPDWSKVHYLSLVHSVLKDKTKKGEISLYSIELSKNYNLFYIISAGLLAAYFLVVVLVFKFKKEKNVVIRFKKIEEEERNYDEEAWKSEVLLIIGKSYSEPDFNLRDLSKQVGKIEKTISKYILAEYDLSFKQYLNTVRLEEACRLLKDPKYSIKEIAFMVGYNSSNHFTRVFKQYKDMLPSEFKDVSY